MRKLMLVSCGALSLLLMASASQAIELPAKTDAQKHRRDISKQLGKYVFCLAKAALKCEKKGAHSGVECDLGTGTAAGSVDPKAAAKFPLDVAKCDSKFDPGKKAKTSDYDQIGCPGDCSPGAPGIQRCTDLAAYETNVKDGGNPSGAKAQIAALAAIIDANCAALHGGLPASTSAAIIDCALNDANRLNKYGKGLNKCGELCENDYKVPNKKGGGGPTDAPVCTGSGDPNFLACKAKKADKQLLKVLAPGNATVLPTLIDAALGDAGDDLYNKDDPTVEPDVDVCSTCGNSVREGSEECDGTDDAACVGTCNADCTCP